MTKVLHISHHYGCLKDHQFICNALNLNVANIFTHWCDDSTIIPKGYFRTTEDLANSIWKRGKEYFNQFDVIVVSDTSPLCRIFLQNIEEVASKVLIWVCNRFDYDVENDSQYTKLLLSVPPRYYEKIKIIPYTEFERVWLNRKGIMCSNETIRPIGLSMSNPIGDEKYSIGFDGKDYTMENISGDILVSRYHNDVLFQNSKDVCISQGLSAEILKFRGSASLKEVLSGFNCYLALPDAYSKFIAFELMQNHFPIIVPSKTLLMKLYQKPKYHFSTGLWENTISLCEWYNEYHSKYAVYINDISEIREASEFIRNNREDIVLKIKSCAEYHTKRTISSWKNVYSDF
jgi:hypothetical protein